MRGTIMATTDKTPAPTTDVNTAPAATEDVTLVKKDLTSVKFVGHANERSISIEEFGKVGVTTTKDLVWNLDNDFTVDVADVSKEALEYLRSRHSDEFAIS
jgi:hypothetical protein